MAPRVLNVDRQLWLLELEGFIKSGLSQIGIVLWLSRP